jgi:hypothetical protein
MADEQNRLVARLSDGSEIAVLVPGTSDPHNFRQAVMAGGGRSASGWVESEDDTWGRPDAIISLRVEPSARRWPHDP